MSTAPDYSLDFPDEYLFTPSDAQSVVQSYVCGVCWEDLNVLRIPGDFMVLVVCEEHGNVCKCGRVTKNTVSIMYEQGARKFREVIRNVPEWNCLIPPPSERKSERRNLEELGF